MNIALKPNIRASSAGWQAGSDIVIVGRAIRFEGRACMQTHEKPFSLNGPLSFQQAGRILTDLQEGSSQQRQLGYH